MPMIEIDTNTNAPRPAGRRKSWLSDALIAMDLDFSQGLSTARARELVEALKAQGHTTTVGSVAQSFGVLRRKLGIKLRSGRGRTTPTTPTTVTTRTRRQPATSRPTPKADMKELDQVRAWLLEVRSAAKAITAAAELVEVWLAETEEQFQRIEDLKALLRS